MVSRVSEANKKARLDQTQEEEQEDGREALYDLGMDD